MNNLIKNHSAKIVGIKESTNTMPQIARWYNNHDCAVSLRFDDNDPSHIKFVIPQLNKYGFKGTFMVNPGRNYKKYKDFWEKVLPQMGHKLGNHTWHHHGAKNPKEAEFEIGEVSKLIWKLYPEETKLNVFASGGGELWGGNRWHKSSDEYKAITKKYHLIDLYDGNHPGIELNSSFSKEKVEKLIDNAIEERIHQAFSFHKIGNKSLKDYLRKIVSNFNYTFSQDQFWEMIKYINYKKQRIWIVDLVSVLKYEAELYTSNIDIIRNSENTIYLNLKIGTDPILYDQELTLLLPKNSNDIPKFAYQNTLELNIHKDRLGQYFVNCKPNNSQIIIRYE